MSDEHASYAEWDAAYVIGALSPSDRLRFEGHLDACERCSAAVADLAGMPGLLARIPTAEGLAMLDADESAAETAPPELLGRLEALAHRDRRVRRIRTWAIAATAAAAAVVGSQVLPLVLDAAGPQPLAAELAPVASTALSADVVLTEVEWGTRLDMTCSYEPTSGYSASPNEPRSYALFVVDSAGVEERVSSWTTTPGSTVRVSGTVRTAADEIRSVQVRAVDTGEILLAASLD